MGGCGIPPGGIGDPEGGNGIPGGSGIPLGGRGMPGGGIGIPGLRPTVSSLFKKRGMWGNPTVVLALKWWEIRSARGSKEPIWESVLPGL